MRKIKREVVECMTDFVVSGHILTSHFIFPEDFVGFQGHFPSNKVLPGVCQIQCITSMLEKWKKKTVLIKEIVLAKFLFPVLPLEEVTCVCKDITDIDDNLIVKAFISKGENRVAEFKLKVCFIDREGR